MQALVRKREETGTDTGAVVVPGVCPHFPRTHWDAVAGCGWKIVADAGQDGAIMEKSKALVIPLRQTASLWLALARCLAYTLFP